MSESSRESLEVRSERTFVGHMTPLSALPQNGHTQASTKKSTLCRYLNATVRNVRPLLTGTALLFFSQSRMYERDGKEVTKHNFVKGLFISEIYIMKLVFLKK